MYLIAHSHTISHLKIPSTPPPDDEISFPYFLSLCTAALAVLVNAKPAQQKSLVGVDIMFKQDKVPGHSDALYDPVPKEDQLFSVEFLEVAPTPILS
jgi:hypothetical protein